MLLSGSWLAGQKKTHYRYVCMTTALMEARDTGHGFPGAGVTGSLQLPEMGVGNLT